MILDTRLAHCHRYPFQRSVSLNEAFICIEASCSREEAVFEGFGADRLHRGVTLHLAG